MLGWFRSGVKSLTAATLALLVVTGGVNVATHGLGGHDNHGPALVVHDAAAHAFTDDSAAPQAEELHCVLCHVTRTVRPMVEVVYLSSAHANRTPPLRRSALRVPAVFPAAEPPLRSPPASL